MMTGIGMGFGGIGLIFMILFWGCLILGGVWLVKNVFASNQHKTSGNSDSKQLSPREILDRRYARGEITREQFELMKADLAE